MGCAGKQGKLAPNLSAQQRSSPKLSPSLQVSRASHTTRSKFLDANNFAAESEGQNTPNQKRAVDDVNSLLDKILSR